MTDAYSHRAVWRIAMPMMIASVSVPLLGMVDTAVMGHLDDASYLAAVAAGSIIFAVLFMGLNFLRMGTIGLTAQAFGAGSSHAVREALGQALITGLALAGVILVLQRPIIDASLWLLAPSETVSGFAADYFTIRIWSAPATLVNFVMLGWMLGMQNARGPLIVTLTINLTNIVLDIVLVVYAGMAVRGVAVATLIAEMTGLLVGLFFVRAILRQNPGHWQPECLLTLSSYRRLWTVNANLFLRSLALMFTFSFITAQGARMGDVILAANALLLNFQFFLSYALDGIANAAEALVGKAHGAKNREGLVTAVRRTLHWSVLFATLFTIIYLLFGEQLVAVLTDIESIRITAGTYLPWLIVLPLISVWCFVYDGVFVGATRSKEMRVIMMGATLLVFLPSWYLFRSYENHALWFSFTLFMAARGIGMHCWYQRLVRTGKIFT